MMVRAMELSDKIKNLIILTVSLILFMELADTSILNTSLPQIARSLHSNPVDLKVALTSYLLSLGVFIPISGWVADKIGVRLILKLAIVIFLVGSIGCGFANSLTTLVIFRIIQGMGGSFMMPISHLALLRIFDKKGIVTVWSKVAPIGFMGAALGPIIGGALTTYATWRLIFFINVPFGLFAIYMIHRLFPRLRQPLTRPFDLIGFVSFGSGLALLLFVIDVIVDPAFSWHSKLLLSILASVCLLFYIWHSRRIQFPMLNVAIFKNHTFALAASGSVTSRFAIGAIPFLIPLMLQTAYTFTALQAGFTFVAVTIGMIVVKGFVRLIINQYGFKKVILVCLILIVMCFYFWSWLTYDFSYIALLASAFIYGMAISMLFTCVNTLVYINLVPENLSMGTSIYSTLMQLSMCFGIAIVALILVMMIGSQNLSQHIPIIDFRHLFIILMIFPLIAFVIFLFVSKDVQKIHV